jgi:hypothetical protein
MSQLSDQGVPARNKVTTQIVEHETDRSFERCLKIVCQLKEKVDLVAG